MTALSVHPDLYPVAIIQDRYSGTYSGGCWLAIANARESYDDTMTRASWCLRDGLHGDDITAVLFWEQPPCWLAAGATPGDAIAKLAGKASATASAECE